MSQNKEATQFLSRLASLPKGPVSLDDVLQLSLQDEAELRKLFATDKGNPRLKDIHVGLVDIFAAPSDIRTTRARVIKDDADFDAHHVMALPSCLRREEGSPAMVENLEAFKKNWAIFTEGSLSQLPDWNNVIAAGGSVQACLMPLPKSATGSKRAMRKYFHDRAFPSSDVDLFLYGLTADEAERKIVTIFEAVRDSMPWEVTCVRTKHTVSIHSQYPYRNIQIVLRLYSSPAEVLAGFDVDAACCAYDGDRVRANPRAIVSVMRQSNTVDMTRRSPSYEVRLAKYCSRGFEVYVPGLKRDEVDPSIYERTIRHVPGLARLLAIEKIASPEAGNQYQLRRSGLRDRPIVPCSSYPGRWRRPGYRGDLKGNQVFSGLEMSDYDVVNLHIPYGLRWDAKRIETLIVKADYCANSPNICKNKNRRLHRHPAFFGTVEECMKDCCKLCPKPENEEEQKLQDEEDKSYVRGRIAFIEEDPGRQSISGSFNPIDEGEWSETAYVQATAKFLDAISKNDVLAVKRMTEDGEELNRRDHVGRTPLHVAIYSHSVEVGCVLIDAGARMTARLVGGRSSLHLAAQMGQVTLVKKMLERSAYNKEKAKEKGKMEEDTTAEDTEGVRMSSDDDWSSQESNDDKPHREPPANKDEPEKDRDPLEDSEEEPDVLDTSIPDWDFGYTPLAFAILSGSLEVVDALLTAGADPSLVIHLKNEDFYWKKADALHPLALTIYTQDEERAANIAERLIAAKAISSTADESLFTTFHRIVSAGKTKIVASLLSHDATATKVLNTPTWRDSALLFPIVSTILTGDYATLSLLLAHGAKLTYSPEDVSRAEEHKRNTNRNTYLPDVPDYRARICTPIETAICKSDEVISLLAALGAEVDVPIKSSFDFNYGKRMSLLQWTSEAISFSESKIAPKATQTPRDLPDSACHTWSQYLAYYAEVLPHCKPEDLGYIRSRGLYETTPSSAPGGVRSLATKEYLTFAESVLRAHGATLPEGASASEKPATGAIGTKTSATSGYMRLSESTAAPVHLKVCYDELYEACWNGDNATIRELCLPKHVAEGKEPIQIAVQTTTVKKFVNDRNAVIGWTPLLVALHRRHWNTARLVLAIAKAQYQPRDTESGRTTDPTFVRLGSSDESGSDEEYYYSGYSTQEPMNFIDIASTPSSVRTHVRPKLMLGIKASHIRAGYKSFYFNPLQKAIVENDFEALLHTLDLYDFVETKCRSFNLAVTLDRPEMVDELIRRSGVGILIPSVATKGRETDSKVSEERVYIGLIVGGKRRVDIKKNNQVKPKTLTLDYELLRNAIRSGATKVIDYLAGPRPIAAYKHYAETHDDEIAQYLKSINDLDAVFPDLLGWKPDASNESPLLCAVIADQLDVLKQTFALKPSLMEEALLLRASSVGFNPLLTAAYYCSGTDIVDFLLEKGVDPSEHDSRGWNIYHLACVCNNKKRVKFVEHLLRTIPKELTHELMAQTSKDAFNTPLMLAVKRQHAETVRTILEFGIDPNILLLRDVDGSTPLHAAVRKTDVVIAELLLKYGPTEHLYIENCVGQTPLDIASLTSLNCLPRRTSQGQLPCLMSSMEMYMRSPPPRVQLETQKREIPKLRATLDTLLSDGSIAPGSKLATELLAFADRMERRLAEETELKKEDEKEKVKYKGEIKHTGPRGTTAAMYIALRDAAAARPGMRRLVHLADTQRSVQRNLEQQSVGAFAQRFQLPQATDMEQEECDIEEKQLVGSLRARSLFAKYPTLQEEDRY